MKIEDVRQTAENQRLMRIMVLLCLAFVWVFLVIGVIINGTEGNPVVYLAISVPVFLAVYRFFCLVGHGQVLYVRKGEALIEPLPRFVLRLLLALLEVGSFLLAVYLFMSPEVPNSIANILALLAVVLALEWMNILLRKNKKSWNYCSQWSSKYSRCQIVIEKGNWG